MRQIPQTLAHMILFSKQLLPEPHFAKKHIFIFPVDRDYWASTPWSRPSFIKWQRRNTPGANRLIPEFMLWHIHSKPTEPWDLNAKCNKKMDMVACFSQDLLSHWINSIIWKRNKKERDRPRKEKEFTQDHTRSQPGTNENPGLLTWVQCFPHQQTKFSLFRDELF